MRTLLMVVGLLIFPGFISAKLIEVKSGETRVSLKDALAAADSGDVIKVYGGRFFETDLVIAVPLTLMGIDWPVIDGGGKGEILSVKADGVRISGVVVANTGRSSVKDFAGIKVYSSRNVVITGNRIEQTFFGVYLENSRNCTVEDNFIESDQQSEHMLGNGIHCWKCDSLHIGCNTISSHRDGIYFEFVTNSSILNNYSFGNMRYGLHFMFSHKDHYDGNVFERNGAGVAVMYTKEVEMTRNVFCDNWGGASYGLLLKDISNSTIERNEFFNNTTGIYMEGTSAIRSWHNEFSGNGYGMRIQANCYENKFSENNFLFNSFDVATNGTRVLNNFEGNFWDKYDGYDLDADGGGDVPYRPVSLYSMVVERMPNAMMLYRSFIVTVMDKAERVMPAITPVELMDAKPSMNRYTW